MKTRGEQTASDYLDLIGDSSDLAAALRSLTDLRVSITSLLGQSNLKDSQICAIICEQLGIYLAGYDDADLKVAVEHMEKYAFEIRRCLRAIDSARRN